MFYKFKLKTNKSALYRMEINYVALFWGQIRKSQDIAFAVVMCLGCVNRSRRVTSAYLRRLDGIKLL